MRTFAACVVLSACGLALAADKKDPKWSDLDHLQGARVVSDVKGFDKDTPPDELNDLKLVIKGHELTAYYGGRSAEGHFTLAETTTPQRMDVTITRGSPDVTGKTFHCIYLLEGPVFKVAFRDPGDKRPGEFITRDRTDLQEVWFTRAPE
jgi:uncharacterized protein (TIGR03067 family)